MTPSVADPGQVYYRNPKHNLIALNTASAHLLASNTDHDRIQCASLIVEIILSVKRLFRKKAILYCPKLVDGEIGGLGCHEGGCMQHMITGSEQKTSDG